MVIIFVFLICIGLYLIWHFYKSQEVNKNDSNILTTDMEIYIAQLEFKPESNKNIKIISQYLENIIMPNEEILAVMVNSHEFIVGTFFAILTNKRVVFKSKFVSFPKYEYFIADKKYALLARKNGMKADTTEEGVNSLIEAIKELMRKLEMPMSLKEAGIDEQEFLAKVDMLADRSFEDQCTTANPRLPLVSELKQILLDSYYGK